MTTSTPPTFSIRPLLLVSPCLLGLASPVPMADEPPDPDPTRFSDQITAFEQDDRREHPEPGQILFVGSSSIRLWDLEDSFPGLDALNRGFGGSQISDVIHFADRVIAPYRPRAIVLYAGDNDVAAGKSAERVRDDLLRLVGIIREMAPEAPILFLAIKPSLSREEFWPEMQRANAMIEAASGPDDLLDFVDVASPMLGPGGRMRPELYDEDRLHLIEDGYAIWTEVLAPRLKPLESAGPQSPRTPENKQSTSGDRQAIIPEGTHPPRSPGC